MTKILIVDDSKLVLEMSKDILEDAGFEVVTHNTPFGTTSVIAVEKPDIVLMDVSMPALSGDRIVKVVKNNKHLNGTKVLLFSARAADELAEIAVSCGADGFIEKNKVGDELIRNLKSWVG